MHGSAKAAMDNTYMKSHGNVPINPYLWTLVCEFHVIFMRHNIFFFDSDIFQPLKNVRTSSRARTKTHGGLGLTHGLLLHGLVYKIVFCTC